MTDGHDGLVAAVKELFPATPRQRCLVYKQRNVLNAVPRRVRHDVGAELAGIWAQPTKQEAVIQLDAFKAKYGKLYPEAVRNVALGLPCAIHGELFTMSRVPAASCACSQPVSPYCHRSPLCGSARTADLACSQVLLRSDGLCAKDLCRATSLSHCPLGVNVKIP